MMVLGIGGSTHDFSACIVIDGRVQVALEEERLSRIKHHSLERLRVGDMRLCSVDYCLREVNATIEDVDLVIANDLVFRGALRSLPKATLVNHHTSHAALVSYLSPKSEKAILVVDGFGSISNGMAETVSYFTAGADREPQLVYRERNKVRRIDERRPFSWLNFDYVEHSLGGFYSFITRAIGFGLHDEGKTMGLAPYGSDRLTGDLLRIADVDGIGRIRFDDRVRATLTSLIGAELAGDDGWGRRADVARAAQVVLERSLAGRAADLHGRTGQVSVAVGGGVFLNSAANQVLREEGPFREFYLHGATGDSGTAIGAALLGYHRRTGRLPYAEEIVYTGRLYTRSEIVDALESASGVTWTEHEDVCVRAAAVLAEGGVVGWFQGRSEFGPRALGNRSILADPSRPEMRTRINAIVKHREMFRPFAPAVLAGRQCEILESPEPSWYMCVNGRVRDDAREKFVSATHVDLSARYQTVTAQSNARFHELIERFAALTGIPGLLNTSFNDSEPIVESPTDAIACFLETEMDCVVIDDFIVTRR